MRFAEVDRELRGYTVVRALEFTCEVRTGECTLHLQLARDEAPSSEVIDVEFSDVSQLTLQGFGGGLTQVLYLRVQDITDEQLDRVNLRVVELEREAISFGCRSAKVARPQTS